jgi:hypothetical protein
MSNEYTHLCCQFLCIIPSNPYGSLIDICHLWWAWTPSKPFFLSNTISIARLLRSGVMAPPPKALVARRRCGRGRLRLARLNSMEHTPMLISTTPVPPIIDSMDGDLYTRPPSAMHTEPDLVARHRYNDGGARHGLAQWHLRKQGNATRWRWRSGTGYGGGWF